MKSLAFVSTSFVLAVSLVGAMADSASLTPDADTYTRAGVNAGTDTRINTLGFGGGDFMGYIRYDLSGLAIDTITDATLTLSVTGASRSDSFTAGRFANFGLLDVAGNTPQNWDEATLAEGNVGAEYGSGTPSSLVDVFNLDAERGANVTETVSSGTGGVNVLTGPDLVSFLNQRVAGGGLATLIVTFDAVSRGNGYASKENTDSALWPRLDLTYTAVPEPSTFALLGMGLMGLLARRRLRFR